MNEIVGYYYVFLSGNDIAFEHTIETTTYLPFGHERNHTGTDISDYKFTDQEKDKETKLYNYDARLYDPVTGQFNMADTLVPDEYNPQSLNRYTYCLNNPLIYVDPTGHFYFGTLIESDPGGFDLDYGGIRPEGHVDFSRYDDFGELGWGLPQKENWYAFNDSINTIDSLGPSRIDAGGMTSLSNMMSVSYSCLIWSTYHS